MKRGQVGMYLLIGLILLFAIIALFFMGIESTAYHTDKVARGNFVGLCLEKAADDALRQLTTHMINVPTIDNLERSLSPITSNGVSLCLSHHPQYVLGARKVDVFIEEKSVVFIMDDARYAKKVRLPHLLSVLRLFDSEWVPTALDVVVDVYPDRIAVTEGIVVSRVL